MYIYIFLSTTLSIIEGQITRIHHAYISNQNSQYLDRRTRKPRYTEVKNTGTIIKLAERQRWFLRYCGSLAVVHFRAKEMVMTKIPIPGKSVARP